MLAHPNSDDRTFAPRLRTPTFISIPPDVAELEEHECGEHREEEERDGRALTEVAPVEPDLVAERREEMRGVHRSAARQHLHDRKVREREDRGEENDDREHRLDEGQRDVAKAPPRAGPV